MMVNNKEKAMSGLAQRMQALGAGTVVDVSKVAAPGPSATGAQRDRTPAEDARLRREAGF